MATDQCPVGDLPCIGDRRAGSVCSEGVGQWRNGGCALAQDTRKAHATTSPRWLLPGCVPVAPGCTTAAGWSTTHGFPSHVLTSRYGALKYNAMNQLSGDWPLSDKVRALFVMSRVGMIYAENSSSVHFSVESEKALIAAASQGKACCGTPYSDKLSLLPFSHRPMTSP